MLYLVELADHGSCRSCQRRRPTWTWPEAASTPEAFASLSAIDPGVTAADRPARHLPARTGTAPFVTFTRPGTTTAVDDDRIRLLELAEACDVPTRWSCRDWILG